MPDALVVPLPVGARMLVVAELLLSRDAPEPSRAAAAGVARAVHSWSGPGAVVVAGDLFDAQGPEDVAPALAGYPGLQRALVDFASGPGRRVVLLPGEHDKWLASQSGAQAVAASLQAEVASAVTAEFCTAGGRKLVQIEALSPLPSSGLTAPLANVLAGSSRVGEDGAGPRPGYSRLSEVVPGVWRGTTSAWLAGMDELDDRDALSRFVASR
ncbi:MAG TPA: hypothetical protein VK425_08425, partial [Acidimicrobiales bacterium]|nr:hypothetical protein [Acidimicrobiales bacterium]